MQRKYKYNYRKNTHDSRDFKLELPKVESLPSSVDLRSKDVPILDQGERGTCTAFSSSCALMYALHREKDLIFIPSENFIYYNTVANINHEDPESDPGADIRTTCKSISKYKVCAVDSWPYDDKHFGIKPNAVAYNSAKQHKSFKYMAVNQTLKDIKTALFHGYPVLAGIQVYESFESDEVAKSGIVPMPKPNEQCLGAHAVTIIGYTSDHFILQNSWSSSWGQHGYFTLPHSYVLDPNLTCDLYAIEIFY